MLFKDFPLRVVADDSDVHKGAEVELLRPEGCVRHGCDDDCAKAGGGEVEMRRAERRGGKRW